MWGLLVVWGWVPVQTALLGIEWEWVFNAALRHSTEQSSSIANLLAVSRSASSCHHRCLMRLIWVFQIRICTVKRFFISTVMVFSHWARGTCTSWIECLHKHHRRQSCANCILYTNRADRHTLSLEESPFTPLNANNGRYTSWHSMLPQGWGVVCGLFGVGGCTILGG